MKPSIVVYVRLGGRRGSYRRAPNEAQRFSMYTVYIVRTMWRPPAIRDHSSSPQQIGRLRRWPPGVQTAARTPKWRLGAAGQVTCGRSMWTLFPLRDAQIKTPCLVLAALLCCAGCAIQESSQPVERVPHEESIHFANG